MEFVNTNVRCTNLRFVPAADTFHAPEDNPANSCYCHDRLCLPSGVFDIGIGCKVITNY